MISKFYKKPKCDHVSERFWCVDRTGKTRLVCLICSLRGYEEEDVEEEDVEEVCSVRRE